MYIYILRALAERAIEVEEDVQVTPCFVDYIKAFDTIKHENLTIMLKTFNIGRRDLRVIMNLSWNQTAAIRYDN